MTWQNTKNKTIKNLDVAQNSREIASKTYKQQGIKK